MIEYEEITNHKYRFIFEISIYLWLSVNQHVVQKRGEKEEITLQLKLMRLFYSQIILQI